MAKCIHNLHRDKSHCPLLQSPRELLGLPKPSTCLHYLLLLHLVVSVGFTTSLTSKVLQQRISTLSHLFDIQTDTVDRSHVPDPRPKHSPRDQATHYDFNALVKQENREDPPITPAQISPLDWSAGPSSGSPSHPQELFHDSNRQFAAALPVYQTYPTTSTWEPITTPASVSQSFPALVQHEIPSIAKVHGLQKPSEGPNRDHEALSQGWQSNQPNHL
jgi:hypothetical protein